MVSYADIQDAYNRLYAQIRKYVWDFSTVVYLADLEIAVYKICQDLSDIRIKCARLKSMITDELYDDEDLKKAMDYFESLITSDGVYVKLNQVQEVVQL